MSDPMSKEQDLVEKLRDLLRDVRWADGHGPANWSAITEATSTIETLSARVRELTAELVEAIEDQNGLRDRALERTVRAQAAETKLQEAVEVVRELWTACRGQPVGGGDGGTYAVGYPTAAQMNRANAFLSSLTPGEGKYSSSTAHQSDEACADAQVFVGLNSVQVGKETP